MSFLNFHGKDSVKFNGHDNPVVPVSMAQYVMHYLYGVNEPALVKQASKILDGIETAATAEEMEKKIGAFTMMSAHPAMKSMPHGLALSQNAAKNVMDFAYYVEGAKGARIAVGPCICQLGTKKYPPGIAEPEIKDITLFYGADIYLDLGMEFEEITADEAKEILDEMHRRGYVHQALYMFDAGAGLFVMCNCDGNVCSGVKGVRLTGTGIGKGPEICKQDPGKCLGIEKCGKCLERCPFGVNKADGDAVIFDQSKCMGCELCVTTCQGGARELEIREDYEFEHIMSKTLLLAGKYGYESMVPYER